MGFRKIFAKNIKPWQVVLICVGSFTGLLLIWLPVQIYFDATSALETHKELLSNQYLVINKSLTALNTMVQAAGFSSKEIADLREQPGVKSVGPFTPNNFRAMVSAGMGKGGPELVTEIFFEAVPDHFIDEIPGRWHWEEGDNTVPVIVPSDYLALYNFGFAPGQSLPQISEGTAKLAGFDIHIDNAGKEIVYRGKIAGFSDRINTILVPQSFIDYGNTHFATRESHAPSRLIIEASDVAAVSAYLEQMGYETNKENLRSGKIQSISKLVLKICLALGGLIVIISLGSFLQFADLLIARSDYEIQTLSFLGYGYRIIAGIIFRQVFGIIAITMLVAAAVGVALRFALLKMLTALVPSPSIFPDVRAICLLVVIVGAYLLISYTNILLQSRRLATPKA